MKRMVFLLTLALCVSAACARAETVYDRGELYDVMNVYAKPDLLSEHLMTYFSGTPVDVMENVAGQEDEIYAHVRVAGQIEGYAQIWDGYGHETVLFSEEAADVPCGILPMLVANPGGRGIVNLRDRPSRSGRILAEIPNGTTVEVMGVKEDDMHVLASWAHVRAGGQTGFMQLDLLTVPNTEAYWLAMAGTYMVLPMRSCSLNDVRPFDPPEITAEALAQALAEPGAGSAVFRLAGVGNHGGGSTSSADGRTLFDRSGQAGNSDDRCGFRRRQSAGAGQNTALFVFAGNTRRRKNGAAGYADGV